MVWREKPRKSDGVLRLFTWVVLGLALLETTAYGGGRVKAEHKNAYASMMYMGTPRDYGFYVATRVMIRSLARLHVDADLVVIASVDVPLSWVRALEQEDGAKVVRVKSLNNPYKNQANFDRRFKLTLNKLYAWSLVDYDRVVMLDSDNLFLQKTDELFQCGQFCAAFINPCIFHTGLFVLKPSMDVFKDMLHQLEIGKENEDGADQGFIGAYFPDLLDQPMFHPPANGTKLDGTYRLPLGYQMDASYYYLRLRWSVPCGPNSVITFPGAPWLKPWYWWSWPVLPLGISWHEQRRQTLGYSAEMPMVVIQSVVYLGIIALTRVARPNLSKLCYRQSDKNINLVQAGVKVIAVWSIIAAYIVPIIVIPCTLHPILAWSIYFLGSFALCSIIVNAFLLPMLPVLVPWLGILGVLFAMAFPWYENGVVRALAVFGYAFCCAPVLWVSLVKIRDCLQVSLEREAFFPRLGESSPPSGFNKLY
ncbi:putative glucuronosyltransferase PGSIP8 [Tripterygium wilfordii]|uniref:putative glucuronosyltransferase PGSIP8 n=1 Tax=Tripterygium wilfordii TaxID=458696 RepID=UPI0018F84B2B|nr:putative glucuronosyltransferase PGSIP8 [Tripterygium wilfordii]